MAVRPTRVLLLGGLALALSGPLQGQQIGAPTVEDEGSAAVTPRSAFVRSLLVPGWGHVATESYARGGFYVTTQAAGLWMLWKSLHRRSDARALGEVERRTARARLTAQGVMDPTEILDGIEGDPAVQEWNDLIEARAQQVEDWAALSIFLVLIGAADAYVAAHLMDYPEPLALRVLPGETPGAVELRISVPLPLTR
jgi:hypothetical protein